MNHKFGNVVVRSLLHERLDQQGGGVGRSVDGKCFLVLAGRGLKHTEPVQVLGKDDLNDVFVPLILARSRQRELRVYDAVVDWRPVHPQVVVTTADVGHRGMQPGDVCDGQNMTAKLWLDGSLRVCIVDGPSQAVQQRLGPGPTAERTQPASKLSPDVIQEDTLLLLFGTDQQDRRSR